MYQDICYMVAVCIESAQVIIQCKGYESNISRAGSICYKGGEVLYFIVVGDKPLIIKDEWSVQNIVIEEKGEEREDNKWD